MSKPLLESLAGAANMMVRVFAILAALSAVVYLFSSWRLHKVNRRETLARAGAEQRDRALQAEISDARAQLDRLHEENLRLEAQLEQEHETRLQLQRRYGPRHVSPAASAAIIAALRPFAGHKLNFGYFAELETAAFAEQLADTLKTAGWKPQIFKLKNIQVLYGIECGGADPGDPALRALAESLQAIDKHVANDGAAPSPAAQALPPPFSNELWILVGLKRPHLVRPAESNAPPAGGQK